MAEGGSGARRVRQVGLVLGPAAFALFAFLPSGLHRIEGMGDRPAYAAGVAAWMALWWFTEALPIALTACIPLLAFPVLGVFGKGLAGDALRTAGSFTDAYIFLFLGGMALGAAMEQWQLHRRVALHIMRALGTEPRRLLLGMLVATASVSLWISNTATAVMMLPIALALIRQLEATAGGARLRHYGTALMLAVAYASNVGGIGTKIGTGTNSIFAGFAAAQLGRDIDFLGYILFSFPFVVLFLPVVWLALWRVGHRDAPRGEQGRAVLEQELRALGPMSSKERTVAVVFGAAACLWIAADPLESALAPHALRALEWKLQGKHVEALVAMLAACSLLALRALTLEGLRRIPYGTLLLLGGSFAMADGIAGSGLSDWLQQKLAFVATLPAFTQLLLACSATVFLSAIASNTATINLMLGVLPRSLPLLASCTIAASCDFALPAGTPPNAIVFGSGYVRLPTMMRVGFALDCAAILLVALYGYLYIPLVLSP